MDYNFIAIEGNIGAGKTSLAKMISDEYNADLILEEFEDNPFLPKFYKDADRYAFPLELSFLAARYQQLNRKLGQKDLFKSFTISDYFVNKSLIFSRKTLAPDEYKLYSTLFHIIHSSLPKPDLFVYLYLSTDKLLQNIAKRGREYEQEISADYLEEIQESYFEFIKQQGNLRTLIIDTNEIDFVNNPEHYAQLKEVIFAERKAGIHRVSL